MPGAGSTPDRSQPRPDDINDRLAEVAAELAAEAKFKEPSAAMRGRVAPGSGKDGPAGPIRRPGPFRNWRNKRAAARLRKPVQPAGHPAAANRRRAAAGRRPRTARAILALAFAIALACRPDYTSCFTQRHPRPQEDVGPPAQADRRHPRSRRCSRPAARSLAPQRLASLTARPGSCCPCHGASDRTAHPRWVAPLRPSRS